MTPGEAVKYLRKKAALNRRVFNGMCRSDQPQLEEADVLEAIASMIELRFTKVTWNGEELKGVTEIEIVSEPRGAKNSEET